MKWINGLHTRIAYYGNLEEQSTAAQYTRNDQSFTSFHKSRRVKKSATMTITTTNQDWNIFNSVFGCADADPHTNTHTHSLTHSGSTVPYFINKNGKKAKYKLYFEICSECVECLAPFCPKWRERERKKLSIVFRLFCTHFNLLFFFCSFLV